MQSPIIPRVILDTNAVLELLHWRDERLTPLATRIANKTVSLYTRPDCLNELARVLTYTHLKISAESAREILEQWRNQCHVVDIATPALPRCSDPDDQKFLQLAVSVDADLLITRDKAVLRMDRRKKFGHTRILTPERAIEWLTNSPETATRDAPDSADVAITKLP